MSQKQVLSLRAVTQQSGFPLTGEVRGFKVTIDEPAILGGTDQAPNPVEYLLLAQAGCLSIVLKTLAQKKKIQLKNIKIEALSSFALSEFLSGKSTGLEEIRLLVGLESDAKLEELKKLLKEAEKICPVKNTLSAKVSVELKEVRQIS